MRSLWRWLSREYKWLIPTVISAMAAWPDYRSLAQQSETWQAIAPWIGPIAAVVASSLLLFRLGKAMWQRWLRPIWFVWLDQQRPFQLLRRDGAHFDSFVEMGWKAQGFPNMGAVYAWLVPEPSSLCWVEAEFLIANYSDAGAHAGIDLFRGDERAVSLHVKTEQEAYLEFHQLDTGRNSKVALPGDYPTGRWYCLRLAKWRDGFRYGVDGNMYDHEGITWPPSARVQISAWAGTGAKTVIYVRRFRYG